MELKEKIQALCAVSAPSGFEAPACELASKMLCGCVDEIQTDAMGNLLAIRRCGKPGAKLLMLDAHMDEIGFIVTGQDKGFLRFANLGGIDPRMLPAREVKILTKDGPIYGIIDTLPPHVLSAGDMDKTMSADKLFIDAGLTEEEAEAIAPAGTPVVFAGGCETLGENMLCGKSLDDRACVAIVIEVMERLAGKKLAYDVCCLISTQEELGLRGATSGAFGAAPDLAIAIDVCHAWTPDAQKDKTVPIGKGAVVALGPNMNREFTNAIIDTAKSIDIPYQLEVIPGRSGTDAWAIQVSRAGVCTALISLPVKYMHTPVEAMNISDAEAIVSLITAYLQKEEA